MWGILYVEIGLNVGRAEHSTWLGDVWGTRGDVLIGRCELNPSDVVQLFVTMLFYHFACRPLPCASAEPRILCRHIESADVPCGSSGPHPVSRNCAFHGPGSPEALRSIRPSDPSNGVSVARILAELGGTDETFFFPPGGQLKFLSDFFLRMYVM